MKKPYHPLVYFIAFNLFKIALCSNKTQFKSPRFTVSSLKPNETDAKDLFQEGTFIITDETPANNTDNENQCGGVRQAFREFSELTYKYQKPINRFESCIWTIQANTSLIELDYIYTYVRLANNADNYLSVGYFKDSNYDSLSDFTWIKLDPVKEPSVRFPGPVIFIHFVATYAWPTLGFHLAFKAVGEDQVPVYNHENYFIGGEFGVFHYPPTYLKYGNNTRTTIVIRPDAGLPGVGESKSSAIVIKKIDLELSDKCIEDNLNVYQFNKVWSHSGQFCGSDLTLHQFSLVHPNNDPIIITFKSDDTGVGNGFTFYWVNFAFQ